MIFGFHGSWQKLTAEAEGGGGGSRGEVTGVKFGTEWEVGGL